MELSPLWLWLSYVGAVQLCSSCDLALILCSGGDRPAPEGGLELFRFGRTASLGAFHPPVGNAHLADRNDHNPHLQPTSAGVQAQPRRSRSRRLGERIPSDQRARVGDWENLGHRGSWAGKALPGQLRFVGKHPLPISPSRYWFALLALCQVPRSQEASVLLCSKLRSARASS